MSEMNERVRRILRAYVEKFPPKLEGSEILVVTQYDEPEPLVKYENKGHAAWAFAVLMDELEGVDEETN